MKHVDLCSGIGGFALGLEWSGLSHPVLFCDSDKWCRSVLAKHWPNVPIAEDVKELALDPIKLVPDCEIITAGYPCQPFSVAGDRRGGEDDRHIWPYIFSIVQAKRPSWCIYENVYGHVSLGLDEVLSDLEREGYAARPFIVPACAVDAPHRRDRVWIVARDVADAKSFSGHEREGIKKTSGKSGQIREPRRSSFKNNLANTQSEGLERRNLRRNNGQTFARLGESCWTKQGIWLPEPPVGRVAHGVPRRVDRLKGLGNAVVPQIVQRIGESIKLSMQEGSKINDQTSL